MHILFETLNDFVIYFKPTTKAGVFRLAGVVAVLGIGAAFIFSGDTPATDNENSRVRNVSVASVAELSGGSSLSLVGSVEAVDRATIQAEVGGRVTSLRVGLGDRVASGQVIATIENASQYASLLQAEGSYEAALAAAAQSDIGVAQSETSLTEARNNAVSVVRNAYTTANNAINNYIDTFFTSPDAQFTPGLRLEGYGYTNYLNEERVSFQTILPQWREEVDTLDATDNLSAALSDAEQRIERVIRLIDTFILLLNDQGSPSAYSASELASYSASFTTVRSELNATLLAIENARTQLESAERAVDRAEISGTGGSVSAADASVKQALGSLRSAQAAYNRTILRSPIAGVIQSLNVRAGDYISAMTEAATVANDNALLVTTYVSNSERARIAVGDSVTLEDDIEGTVTAIAPAVDPATGKVEVQIQSQSDRIQNGDTVRVTFNSASEVTPITDGPVTVPVTALKVENDRIIVFTVSDDNTLIAHPIVEGPLLGSSIVVAEGITADMEIVTDARGLNEGDTVTVTSN